MQKRIRTTKVNALRTQTNVRAGICQRFFENGKWVTKCWTINPGFTTEEV